MTRRALLLWLAGMVSVLAAAGCGKKDPPKAPDPEKDYFPKQYPKPE